jgi:hypothetical protein
MRPPSVPLVPARMLGERVAPVKAQYISVIQSLIRDPTAT